MTERPAWAPDGVDVQLPSAARAAPGSLVALSHLTADQNPGEMAVVAEARKNSRDPMYFRPYAEVTRPVLAICPHGGATVLPSSSARVGVRR